MNIGYLIGTKVAADTTKMFADAVSKPFTPNSVAMKGSGELIAGLTETAVRGAVDEIGSPIGKALFKGLSSDLGGAWDAVTGSNNQSITGN